MRLFSDILGPVSSSAGNETRNISRSKDQINAEASHPSSSDHATSVLLDSADSLSIAGCQNNNATQERSTIFNPPTSYQIPTASLPSTGDSLQLPNPYPSSLLGHKRKYDEVSVNDVIIANLREEHAAKMKKHTLAIQQMEIQTKKIELEMKYMEVEHKARMAIYEKKQMATEDIRSNIDDF